MANNGRSSACVMVITDAGFAWYVSFIIVPCPDNICIVLNAFE